MNELHADDNVMYFFPPVKDSPISALIQILLRKQLPFLVVDDASIDFILSNKRHSEMPASSVSVASLPHPVDIFCGSRSGQIYIDIAALPQTVNLEFSLSYHYSHL